MAAPEATWAAAPVNADSARIRIGLEEDTPPLAFLDARGKLTGFTAELLRAVTQANGTEFEIVPGSRSQLMREFEAGRLDALGDVVNTPQRAVTMDFSVGHASVHVHCFARSRESAVQSTQDFAGKKIAVISGSSLHQTLELKGPWGAHWQPYPTRQAALEAVARKECDFALLLPIGSELDARQLHLVSNFIEDLKVTFHVAVHQGDSVRLDQINEGLGIVLRNGTLDRLYDQWIGPTEPHPIRLVDLRPYLWPLVLVALGLGVLLIAQHWAIAVRRRAQLVAQARADELAVLMDASPALIFIAHDPQCQRVTGNDAATAFMRLSQVANLPPSALQAGQPKITYRDLNGRVLAREELPIQRAINLGRPVKGTEITLTFPDGTEHVIYGHAAPLFDAEGSVRGAIGTFLDITERKQAEHKLHESIALLNEAQRIAQMGSWRLDLATNAMSWSDELCRMSGLKPGQTVPPFAERQKLYLPETQRKLHEAIDYLRTTDKDFSVEVDVIRGGCEQRCVLVRGDVERNAAGTVVALHGTAHDITEQKLAAEALRVNERRYRLQAAALEATLNSVMITDAAGLVEWVNPAFTRTTGYTPAEIVGSNARILRSGVQPDSYFASMWSAIRSGQSWSGEFISKRKDGNLLTEEIAIAPVRTEGRDITHFVAVKQDVTEKRSLEKQLVETQRLESIGLLASGIAHDLNNIIAPITLSIELLRAKYPGEQRTLEMIEQCARRGADVVRQVLTFSRGMDGTRVPLRIGLLVKEMGHLMSETLPRNIAFTYDVNVKEDTVRADHTQIHQVILNLGVNARDAMPRGGALGIKLSNATLQQADLAGVPGTLPGGYLVIAVSDTGTGIPPEVLPRIFEPFFTTKPRGQGTGLGLSTVHGIVRSHDGFIKVQSEVGVGTTFRVYLPLVTQAEPASKSVSATPFAAGEDRLVLVADDEPAIRDTTRLVLESHGYRVLTAENGLEAVKLFQAHRTEVKYVLLDRMMPGMSGESAALIIHQLEPATPVILATGLLSEGSSTGLAGELKAAGITTVLRKPYTADRLLRELRS